MMCIVVWAVTHDVRCVMRCKRDGRMITLCGGDAGPCGARSDGRFGQGTLLADPASVDGCAPRLPAPHTTYTRFRLHNIDALRNIRLVPNFIEVSSSSYA